ncbi:anti-sigma factor domain-containing protein [Pseudonocardia terrae]|uniref:anti-sigma factor domain-containing protein n=1 Tax=Pseudonocardia terrae TaxID=2905831 RepID=UPI0035563E96
MALAATVLVAVAAIAGLGVYRAQLKAQRDAEAARAQGMATAIQEMGEAGTRSAFLTATGSGPVVAVVTTHGTDRDVLPVGLHTNGYEQIYVVWGLPASGTPTALGTFDVRSDTTNDRRE